MASIADQFDQLVTLAGSGGPQTAGLLFARILPIVAFTPLFGGQSTPRRLRMGLTILLTAAMLPGFGPPFMAGQAIVPLSVLLLKETLIGFTLALCVTVLFQIFTAFGELVDLARGATMGNALDPLTQNQESPLSFFYTQFALVLFFTIGGPRVLLDALGDSFAAIPVQATLPRHLLGVSAVAGPIRLGAELFAIALRLAAPVFVVLLLLDISLGLVNRVAQQVQVYFLSLTIKGSLGIFIVLIGLATFVSGDFAALMRLLKAWMKQFGA